MNTAVTVNFEGIPVDIELTSDQMDIIMNIVSQKTCVEKYIPTDPGDPYVFVYPYEQGKYHIQETTYGKTCLDAIVINAYPVFKTKNEATVYEYYLKMLDKYTFKPNWEDETESKFNFDYCHDDKDLYINEHWTTQDACGIYFKNRADILNFRDTVGIDNIKKFMFNIWD